MALYPVVLDGHVLALHEANFAQTFVERGYSAHWQAIPLINPITGIAGCCVRATSGHATPHRRAA